MKLGGPTHIEHVCKYRRLQQIEQDLEQSSSLIQQELHVLPVINVLEKDDEDNEEQPDTT
jgi:hypothetical protein